MRSIRFFLLLTALLALLSGCTTAVITHVSAGRAYDVFFNLPSPEEKADYLRSGKDIMPVCKDIFVVPRITLITHEEYRLQVLVFSCEDNSEICVESLCLTDADGKTLYTLPGETALLLTESDGMYTAALASEPFPAEKVQPGSDLTLHCILIVDGEAFDLTWNFSVSQQRVPVFPV